MTRLLCTVLLLVSMSSATMPLTAQHQSYWDKKSWGLFSCLIIDAVTNDIPKWGIDTTVRGYMSAGKAAGALFESASTAAKMGWASTKIGLSNYVYQVRESYGLHILYPKISEKEAIEKANNKWFGLLTKKNRIFTQPKRDPSGKESYHLAPIEVWFKNAIFLPMAGLQVIMNTPLLIFRARYRDYDLNPAELATNLVNWVGTFGNRLKGRRVTKFISFPMALILTAPLYALPLEGVFQPLTYVKEMSVAKENEKLWLKSLDDPANKIVADVAQSWNLSKEQKIELTVQQNAADTELLELLIRADPEFTDPGVRQLISENTSRYNMVALVKAFGVKGPSIIKKPGFTEQPTAAQELAMLKVQREFMVGLQTLRLYLNGEIKIEERPSLREFENTFKNLPIDEQNRRQAEFLDHYELKLKDEQGHYVSSDAAVTSAILTKSILVTAYRSNYLRYLQKKLQEGVISSKEFQELVLDDWQRAREEQDSQILLFSEQVETADGLKVDASRSLFRKLHASEINARTLAPRD